MVMWEVLCDRNLLRVLVRGISAASLLFVCALVINIALPRVHAGSIHNYSDTISTSIPARYANHTIQFQTTVAIPPSGFVRFTPLASYFTIPASDFDHKNVELAVATSSGYHARYATSTASSTADGVTIVPGTDGYVEVTLNDLVGIPANAYVQLRIGDHTTYATSSDLGIRNPLDIGSYDYRIEAGIGGSSTMAIGKLAVVDGVTVGPIDTHEFIPPYRFNGAPTGTISGTTEVVEMSLETNEFAKCRYSTASGTPFYSMSNEFTTTYRVVHPVEIAVATNTAYTFYVRCVDDEGNINTDDYVITFTVPAYPVGTPGTEGDQEGQGSGTGEGSGSSDPGNGDPSGNDNASGGTTGGGTGGGGGGGNGSSSGGDSGSGGFEGTSNPYQSGDGRVIITGYAFPQSKVVVLVDGQIAITGTANNQGAFSITVDAIARGVYTFGVYAIDANGTKSSTYSTTFSIVGSRGSTLSNVNVMPSIKVSPDPVNPGGELLVTGYAIPNAQITIENQNDKTSASLKTFTATSDAKGKWSVTIDTTGFTTGTYKVRAKAKQELGVSTNYSSYTYYGVGEKAKVPMTSDLNRDGKVNLTDFSILLFWWNTDGGASNPPADINQDGKVSLTDFSIMIFNWTG